MSEAPKLLIIDIAKSSLEEGITSSLRDAISSGCSHVAIVDSRGLSQEHLSSLIGRAQLSALDQIMVAHEPPPELPLELKLDPIDFRDMAYIPETKKEHPFAKFFQKKRRP